jgi:ABC-type phosphate transport system auxiliary subunit
MDWTERSFTRYIPLAAAVLLLVVGITRLLQRRKPRSFRDDPIGALKDRSEMIADRAQEATEEVLARLQESLDEIRNRLPEVNRKRMDKRRRELNKRVSVLNDQAQALLKELRSSSMFGSFRS